MKRVKELEDLARHLKVEPEAETVEEIRKGLVQAWRTVEQRGSLHGA